MTVVGIGVRFAAGMLVSILAASAASAQADSRSRAIQRWLLLQEAAASAQQIPDLRNRTYAMVSLASVYNLIGDEASARATYDQAVRLWEAMPGPPGQKFGIGMIFVTDYESAVRVAEALPNDDQRDRMFDQILVRLKTAWGTPEAQHILGKIGSVSVRELAMLRMLQGSKCADAALAEIPSQVTLPNSKAMALALIAQCEQKSGGLPNPRFSEALALALDSSPNEPPSGPPNSYSCEGPRGESPRDVALEAIGRAQVLAADFAGALVTANAIRSGASRGDLMIFTAVGLVKKERFAEGLAIVEQVPTGLCRDAALSDVAPELWRKGARDAAGTVLNKIESGNHRAYALAAIARIEIGAKRKAEALPWLAEAANVALQTPDPMDGYHAALDVSGLQSGIDGPAALATVNRIYDRVKDMRVREPNRWQGMLSSLADRVALAGNAAQGLALVQEMPPVNRAPSYRRIAESQVRRGGLPEAMVWIGTLRDPFEKCFALMGAASGLWITDQLYPPN